MGSNEVHTTTPNKAFKSNNIQFSETSFVLLHRCTNRDHKGSHLNTIHLGGSLTGLHCLLQVTCDLGHVSLVDELNEAFVDSFLQQTTLKTSFSGLIDWFH